MPEYITGINYEGQINKILDKNIHIPDKEKAILNLKNHSYYTLINGFKRYFLAENESDIMKNDIDLDDF